MWIVRLKSGELLASKLRPYKLNVGVNNIIWCFVPGKDNYVLNLRPDLFPEIKFENEPEWKRMLLKEWFIQLKNVDSKE